MKYFIITFLLLIIYLNYSISNNLKCFRLKLNTKLFNKNNFFQLKQIVNKSENTILAYVHYFDNSTNKSYYINLKTEKIGLVSLGKKLCSDYGYDDFHAYISNELIALQSEYF